MNPRIAAFTLALAAATSASAAELTGNARIVDGDTIVVNGLAVRISGIDAPEKSQYCTDSAGLPYACGQRASAELAGIIKGREVVCVWSERDRYARVLGQCRTTEAGDLGDAIVRAGWATDYTKYSHGRYLPAQAEAQGRGSGMWSGTFQMPETWRREHPRW